MIMMIQSWTRRLIAWIAVLALGTSLFPTVVSACSQCFGTQVSNNTTFGITMSMLGLLGFLGIVWGGVGLFVWRVRRRSKMLEPENLVVTQDGEIQPQDD